MPSMTDITPPHVSPNLEKIVSFFRAALSEDCSVWVIFIKRGKWRLHMAQQIIYN